ncbi:hypothetical protein HC766_02715 [Candidatus Gracilibacteria bacterium]|nr:hypothetical protein [Candidatus Gracilibacteria bacterium]
MPKWSNSQLFIETIPRSIFFSYVQIFLLNGLTPNQLLKNLSATKPHKVDPLFLLTQTYKNYQLPLDKLINLFSYSEYQDIISNNYGVVSKHTFVGKNPIWAHYSNNKNWYHKQIAIFQKLQLIYYIIPGIKNIYLTASTTVEISGNQRDLDIIIHTNKHFVWPVRLLVKLLIKIQGQDVHSFLGELGLLISQLLDKFKIFRQFSSKIAKKSTQKIFVHKNREGFKIDIGLIYSNPNILPKIFYFETRHLLFFTSLRMNFTTQISSNNDFFRQGELLYEPYLATYTKYFWLIIKFILSVCCMVFSPLILLIYFTTLKKIPPIQIFW